MKHLFALVLMLRVWGHFQAELDEYPIKFDGVVVQWMDKTALIRDSDGTIKRVYISGIEGSRWEEVDE